MTIDEAIAHALEVAEQNETQAEKIGRQFIGSAIDKYAIGCRECASDHRQLAEWLRELKVLRGKIADICSILAAYYGCPCDHSPQDEIMEERGNCEDCGEISNAECWSRFLETEIQLDREGIQDNTNKMYAEIKDLREENKVLTSECDRLIKEKGELLKKSEQIVECKRLLKMAVEDLSKMPCNNDTHSPDSCYICVKHGNCSYADSFKWCKADIALKLIGGSENET